MATTKDTGETTEVSTDNVDANAPQTELVTENGTSSVVVKDTLADKADAVETPKAGESRPFSDPNGGPKSTPEVFKAETDAKQASFDKRETYLDINDPAHANLTYAQLQEKAGADVKNMR